MAIDECSARRQRICSSSRRPCEWRGGSSRVGASAPFRSRVAEETTDVVRDADLASCAAADEAEDYEDILAAVHGDTLAIFIASAVSRQAGWVTSLSEPTLTRLKYGARLAAGELSRLVALGLRGDPA